MTERNLSPFRRRVMLRDGTILEIRLLHPDEQEKIRALLAGCSPASLRYRFLHPLKVLSESDLKHLIQLEGTHCRTLAVRRDTG